MKKEIIFGSSVPMFVKKNQLTPYVISSEVEKSHSYEVFYTTFGKVILIIGHFI